MVIEISDVFLKEGDSKTLFKIELTEPKKITEILKEIKFDNIGYADFYLNNKKIDKNTIAKNKDKLLILPIVGGG